MAIVAGWILIPLFRVRTEGFDVVRKERGAFLLVGNHSAVIDPFLVGCLFRRPIQFVASDSQLRSRAISLLLGLVGVIPKTKALADLDTVKRIVTVKNSGGVIGLFPEGQSGWDGHSLPIIKSTEKLVKSLKIPVITAQIRGAYFSWPRWARGLRRGAVTIYFEKILEPRNLKAMSVDEVGSALQDALTFDAFEYQQRARVEYDGARRAEYLERALFVCPECNGVNSLRSHGQRLSCTSCGYSVRMNRLGFFEQRRGPLHFATIRSWNLWQIDEYYRYIDTFFAGESTWSTRGAGPSDAGTSGLGAPAGPIIAEEAVQLYEGYKTQPLKSLGAGPMRLFPDVILAEPDGSIPVRLPIERVEGINVQNNEHLEFYVDDTLYRVSPVDPRGNTYKWDLAVKYIRETYRDRLTINREPA